MRITVKPSGMHGFTLILPTGMIFCPILLRAGIGIGRKYTSAVPDVSKEDLRKLCHAVKQVKKRYGHYELVSVESCDGNSVRVVL